MDPLEKENKSLLRMVSNLSHSLDVAERRNSYFDNISQKKRNRNTVLSGAFATFLAVSSAAIYLGAESFQDNETIRLQTECDQWGDWLTDDKSDNQMTEAQINKMNDIAIEFIAENCAVGRSQ